MIQKPLHPELSLWMGAIERLNQVGVSQLSAIPSRIFTLENQHLGMSKWEIPIKLKRLRPELPIL